MTTYPLSTDGPLCPLFTDPNLLLDFYDKSQMRKALKKHCKSSRWEGKPPSSYSMGDATLKKMLISLLNNPVARGRLVEKDFAGEDSPALHQAIWGWVAVQSPGVAELVGSHCHEVDDRVFMSVEELTGLIAAANEKSLLDDDGSRHLAYLTAAFAMLQPDTAGDLLATFCAEFPAFRSELGLSA